MRTLNISIKITVLLLLICTSVVSQSHHNEEEDHKSEKEHHEEHSELKKHTIGFVVSHTHINSAEENPDGSKWIAAPSFCINYNFNISHKWSIGLHNDIIIETIDLEHTHEGGDGIKRERPISAAIMGSYKLFDHFVILAGGGMEFSNHEDFAVVRIGFETPIHIQNNWEIFTSLTGDIGIENYDSFTFGFGISKLF